MSAIAELSEVTLRLTAQSGEVEILRGVSLAIQAGESLGLVGPSGSGKSTLLMVLAGLERASSGRITVMGRDLSHMGEDALAVFRRQHIGIVFQSFHLIPTMTALENVAVPLELGGARDAFARARHQLDAVGLGPRVAHLPSQLSGGEQQRVALARAIAPRPSLLLADEPTGNLDAATGAGIIDLLFELKAASGTSLLLITHDAELAARCDRIARLRDGRIASIEPARAQAAQ
jgi:putative ABC transport system ATP-binding protein